MGLQFGQLADNPLQKARKSNSSTHRKIKKHKKSDSSPAFLQSNSVKNKAETGKYQKNSID